MHKSFSNSREREELQGPEMIRDERVPSFSTLSFPFSPLPDHPSGMMTPPLQTLASVPFRWEELPGKPIPCTDIVVRPEPAKGLGLPPCRISEHATKFTRMPSPTTVLDGPYNLARPKFSSFRLLIQSSNDSSSSSSSATPPSSVDVFPGKKIKKKTKKKSWYFGRSLNGGKEVDGGSFGFSPYRDSLSLKTEGKMRRNGSFSGLSTSSTHLWVTVRETLRNAIPIPWKTTRKSKKEAGLKECDI